MLVLSIAFVMENASFEAAQLRQALAILVQFKRKLAIPGAWQGFQEASVTTIDW
jgi:hypothetical protein